MQVRSLTISGRMTVEGMNQLLTHAQLFISLNLSEYLIKPEILETFPSSHKTLELCSGTSALPSQFLSLLTSSSITASETSSVLSRLKMNVCTESINLIEFEIGESKFNEKWDTIIACECVYDSIDVSTLASTCYELCNERVLLAGVKECRLSEGDWSLVESVFTGVGFKLDSTVYLDEAQEYICMIFFV